MKIIRTEEKKWYVIEPGVIFAGSCTFIRRRETPTETDSKKGWLVEGVLEARIYIVPDAGVSIKLVSMHKKTKFQTETGLKPPAHLEEEISYVDSILKDQALPQLMRLIEKENIIDPKEIRINGKPIELLLQELGFE